MKKNMKKDEWDAITNSTTKESVANMPNSSRVLLISPLLSFVSGVSETQFFGDR